MSKKSAQSPIKCRATRRYLFNGNETDDLQGIRVTAAYPQKRTLNDMAKSINHSTTANEADVLAVWTAMEAEIIRTLCDGNRVELGTLGTLSLEIGTRKRKSATEGITSKDIEAKGIIFTPSKKVAQRLRELTFECDGIVGHPLSSFRADEALAEYFATHQYISARGYATLCHCSESTARRRIAQMLSEGKLEPSGIAKGLFKLKIES